MVKYGENEDTKYIYIFLISLPLSPRGSSVGRAVDCSILSNIHRSLVRFRSARISFLSISSFQRQHVVLFAQFY